MATTNEMIFATLKTRGDKTPKYAEQLRAIGYEVDNIERCGGSQWERDYWAVNGLQIGKGDDGTVYLYSVGRRAIKKLDNIKKVDFVNYFATRAERQSRRAAASARGDIWQVKYHYTQKSRECVNPDARWSEREYRTVKHHYTEYREGNETIRRYKELRDRANGRRYNTDELSYAEKCVKRAEEAVQNALKRLKEAQEDLAKEKVRKAEGSAELNEFLKAKGVR